MIFGRFKSKIIFSLGAIVFLFGLSACSLEASISSQDDPLNEILERKSPDLTYGEVVTTSQGFQFTGVFGETSEKTKSINGNQWQFEGAFYE